jgi:hypothetical protein
MLDLAGGESYDLISNRTTLLTSAVAFGWATRPRFLRAAQ